MDPKSDDPDAQSLATHRFKQDESAPAADAVLEQIRARR